MSILISIYSFYLALQLSWKELDLRAVTKILNHDRSSPRIRSRLAQKRQDLQLVVEELDMRKSIARDILLLGGDVQDMTGMDVCCVLVDHEDCLEKAWHC